MKIKNISTKKIVFSDLYVPNTLQNLELLPNEEIAIYDEDAEKSTGLKLMMDAGKVSKVSDEEPLDSSLAADNSSSLQNALLSNDKLIQFITDADEISVLPTELYPATASTPKAVRIVITDGDGSRSYANSQSTVLVTASGGTVNGLASDTITFADGLAEVEVLKTSAGNVDLTLSAITHPLSADVPPVLVTAAGAAQVQFA